MCEKKRIERGKCMSVTTWNLKIQLLWMLYSSVPATRVSSKGISHSFFPCARFAAAADMYVAALCLPFVRSGVTLDNVTGTKHSV